RGWGIPAVVGAVDLEVRDGEVSVGGRVLHAGDLITIDGGTGEVFEGAVAGIVLANPEDVQPVLDALVAKGLVAPSAGALRLTESGSSRATELLAKEQAAWGIGNAEAALDAFLALDQRMKEIVTAWQMRDVAAGTVNDHTDADYDRAVLDRLGALHADAI